MWCLRYAVRVCDRARLDRSARKHSGWQAAEASGLLAAIAASLVVVFVTLVTFSTSPASEPLLPSHRGLTKCCASRPMGFGCGIGSTLAGGMLVLFFSWMFRNSLATRPTVAGALYGAGAGLAINAGWRIACPVSTPWRAVGAHGAAIIATVLVGTLIGCFLGNRRLHIGGRRS